MSITTLRHQPASGQFNKTLLPPDYLLYERELGKLKWSSKGEARTNCVLHGGKNKTSLSVWRDGHFHCHSCGVGGGDFIAFYRERHGVGFVQACRNLGCWQEPPLGSEEHRQRAREREQQRKKSERIEGAALALRERARAVRLLYRNKLHAADRKLVELTQKPRGNDGAWWQELVTVHERQRYYTTGYMLVSLGSVAEQAKFALGGCDVRDEMISAAMCKGYVGDENRLAHFHLDDPIGVGVDDRKGSYWKELLA